MLDHVTIRVADRAAAERFYALVLAELEAPAPTRSDGWAEWDDFSLAQADAEHGVTRRLHLGFTAPSREHVDAFWRAGVEAGYRSDGAPGLRPQYLPDYYGAFLLDPDGNSAEAVHYDGVRADGVVDHLWLRTRDVEAASRFWDTVAEPAGVRVRRLSDGRTIVDTGGGGTFSFVEGEPTENVHLAVAARDDAQVEAFWRAATGAGYRDNGAPGERPHYHPGYVGAFVLDPDGHNVEAVCHNR